VSYSIGLTEVPKGDLPDVLDGKIQEHLNSTNHGEAEPQVREHFAHLREVVLDTIEKLFPGYSHLHVAVSGHANPGGAPAEGYANDVATVTVSGATVAPAEVPPTPSATEVQPEAGA
jgi:hypothetical protein